MTARKPESESSYLMEESKIIVDLARLSMGSITVADLDDRYGLTDGGTLTAKISHERFDAIQAILAKQRLNQSDQSVQV